ncbi:hypothetical protein LAZ67_14002785 [Cordylochernes scorpioides]|uniref:Transposase n=1 Tax=Cordylochernes scorpioides TaxID=51811 RepID=A0ABY6L814_9ARAC|nr:hypothetical protein LAZ67_14002785 [Cordylochernes scorpioides]
MYSVGRRTKRWPLCLFFNFLDVVAINSAVIYKAVKQDCGMARKDFIKQLALQLMRDALNMINQAKNLSRDLQVLIQKHAGTSSLERHAQFCHVKSRVKLRFVALTRKQRHVATEIGLGLPHPVREWIRPAAGRQFKYPPTNQGRVGDTAVPRLEHRSSLEAPIHSKKWSGEASFVLGKVFTPSWKKSGHVRLPVLSLGIQVAKIHSRIAWFRYQ